MNGQTVQMKNPLSARHAGIAMIHQELQHVPELSVAQNMFLGRPLTGQKVYGWINTLSWKERS